MNNLELSPADARAKLAELADALKPLADAPGCSWCGAPAYVYISRLNGDQRGECCTACLHNFGEEAEVTDQLAAPDVDAIANAPLHAIVAAWDAMQRVVDAAIEAVCHSVVNEVRPDKWDALEAAVEAYLGAGKDTP